jgi:simple sugar transport system permease protein
VPKVIPGLAKIKPPLLSDIPVIGPAVFEQVWLLYAGIALIVATALVLRYTSTGIAIHAAGAEPKAVDKSGLSVTRIRYGCVLFAGLWRRSLVHFSRSGTSTRSPKA